MYTFYIMYTYTHNGMQKKKKKLQQIYIGRILNVMDVRCMVSCDSR